MISRLFCIFAALAAVALSACTDSVPSAGQNVLNTGLDQSLSSTPADYGYAVLYRFTGPPDAYAPRASLFHVNNVLYGTSQEGGTFNIGTVFSLAPGASEHIVYSFGSGNNDGAGPFAGLIDVNGTLYGTEEGPIQNQGTGTVFSVTPTGAERILHVFTGSPDGAYPVAGLLCVNGTLYGTTTEGGNHNNGTVFSIDLKTGAERVLYSFKGSPDGGSPEAALIDINGTLYGTSFYGGIISSGKPFGAGTVFSINPENGTEKVLHAFTGGLNGGYPTAGVINVDGILYGTTSQGGDHNQGTIFSIDPESRHQRMLYAFKGGTDGIEPMGLVNVRGMLYGTTFSGGAHRRGTIFSFDLRSVTEKVLHAFGSSADDGAGPDASLINVNNVLYGTTYDGGLPIFYGYGTVFKIVP